jgi:AcrR family transcriptional regulator
MSPRRADPLLANRRREELIRAGYAEILENGIHGTTLDAVVARAGSSKGGALYYYHTKEDLLAGVIDWLLNQLDLTLDQVALSDAPPRARLASELEVLFHSADVNRKLYLVLFDFIALSARSSRFRERFHAFVERSHQRDVKIIEQGIEQQQFRRVDPNEIASTIRALVDGYCLQWLLGPEGVPIETYRDRCRAVLGACLLR